MSQQAQSERGTNKEGDGLASFSWPQRPTTQARQQQRQQQQQQRQQPQHAHLDCFSGIAGDMLLAACIDVGGPTLLDYVTDTLRKGLPALANEFTISHQRVWRGVGQIAATHVIVSSVYGNQAVPVPQKATASQDHSHGHSHGGDDDDDDDAPKQQDHSHEHSHGHSHEQAVTTPKPNDDATSTTNSHSHSHHHHHEDNNNSSHAHGPLRNLPQIRQLLQQATAEQYIPSWVRRVALVAFTLLAEAEAHVHHAASVDAVHFHEVGAVDSIVDTIGSLLALHALLGLGGNNNNGKKNNNCDNNNNNNIISISCTALPLGCGTVRAAHGLLPVPAPAALYLLRGLPVCAGPPGVTGELITPTGVALVRALLQECNNSSATTSTTTSTTTDRPPRFTLRHVGIGAGTKDFVQHPNILRLLVGDLIPEHQQTK